ncbi:DUF2528 family protein [Salegentibacter maritimus]|uniref:DUF2528 family protein n=1 Tax=Salegentibacter maritimus TaxID=2794347 RepID=A0ABS0TKM5_9FLAO|nr:DUF2528 family protein [Salegentibacter maritimus]MBI6121345.1 DUF2528 family protein [Salegentibacter maritimus]
MNIKKYKYNYDNYTASVEFEVDLHLFGEKQAKQTLDFFSWDEEPDYDNNLVDEVMLKYARMAIILATENNHNTRGVISDFNEQEGYYNVDGSFGIKLLYVEGVQIEARLLELEEPSE